MEPLGPKPKKGPFQGQMHDSSASKGSFQSQPPPPPTQPPRDPRRHPRTTTTGPRTSQEVAPSTSRAESQPLVERQTAARPATRPLAARSATHSDARPAARSLAALPAAHPAAPSAAHPAAPSAAHPAAPSAAHPAARPAFDTRPPSAATTTSRHAAATEIARSERRAPPAPAIAYRKASAQAEPAARASRPLAAELAEWTAQQETHLTPSFSMPSLDMDEEMPTSPVPDHAPSQWMTRVSPECRERAALILREQLVATGHGRPGDAELCAQSRQSCQDFNLDPEEEALLAELASELAAASQPFRQQTLSRRPRPDTDSDEEDAEAKRQRISTASNTQAAKHVAARAAPPAESYLSDMEEDEEDDQPHVEAHAPKAASPTYADTAKAKAPAPAKPAAVNPTDGTSRPPPQQTPGKKPTKARYPPLIVDSMPNWAHHFRTLKAKLGRAPNARPFGKGVKFTPQEDQEFRLIQRYLTDLEKTEKLSWFSYSLPADRNLKVALRGIPADTDPEDIMQDLREQGFDPEFARPIRARRGRPGCIFLLILRRTPNLTPAIYEINEVLCMPGVTIEQWRGKRGPAQCHRCQKFRHSSHNCHRQQACVRCGGEHSAHECTRPLDEPASCANCEGPHPANHAHCTVFRKEARNKRAGTTAATVRVNMNMKPEGPKQRPEQGTNIRTPANDPINRGAASKGKRKRRPRRKRHEGTGTSKEGEHSTGILRVAIDTLKKVLEAIMEGKNVTSIVLEGLNTLTAQE